MGRTVTNVAIGAGIRLSVNVVNRFRRNCPARQMLHARDAQQPQAHQQFVSIEQNPFVKATRRMLFFMLTGLLLLPAHLLCPCAQTSVSSACPALRRRAPSLAWIFGSSPKVNVEPITLSGGLLLWQFQHVIQLCNRILCLAK